MKENTKKIAIVLLIAIIAVGSYFVSGTYAKYVSTIAGNDNANVAKWSWTIDGNEITTVEAASKTYTFDLFNTINDTKDGNKETDVDANLIAPGTTGAFDIKIINNSQVNAMYGVVFEEEQTPSGINIPIQYSIDGEDWKDSISDVKIEASESTTKLAMNGGTTADNAVKLYWRWVYTVDDARDVSDTAIGFSANTTIPNVKVTAKVTVTQIN